MAKSKKKSAKKSASKKGARKSASKKSARKKGLENRLLDSKNFSKKHLNWQIFWKKEYWSAKRRCNIVLGKWRNIVFDKIVKKYLF